MDWFKTKKPKIVSAPSSPDHLLALVRTMEDDLSGRQVPTEIPVVPEPLVTFHPDTTVGAPFFSTAPVDQERAQSTTPEVSPFLQESAVPEPVSVTETQTFDPPLMEVPAAPIAAEGEGEATTVAFNTAPQSVAPSFRASLRNLSSLRGLLSIFQDRKLRLAAVVAGLLFLVALSAGLYFWWSSEESGGEKQPDVQVESPQIPETKPRVEPLSQAKYFANQPNILSFDTETVTADQIKTTLLQVGQAIKKDNLPGAVEFLVRDQKLNPLAFSRFAYLAKLNIPAELLGTLDEAFSLYVVIDDARPRLVLLSYIKDQPAFTVELQRNEKNLAQAIDSLFLDVTTAPKSGLAFRDGTYLERPVRFANVDASIGLSVDYAVRGRQWIVGTSKSSLRAVLDKTGL